MNCLGIIPARFASSRLPGKPLADLGGKTLIQRTYENASKAIRNLIVATDHEQVLEAVKNFGGRVMMTGSEHRSGTDRCNEVAGKLAEKGETYDVIMNIQGDEPFINMEDLRGLIDMFDEEETLIATLSTPVRNARDVFDPNVVKVVSDVSGRALYFSRSAIPFQRNIPEDDWISGFIYHKHLGIYGYRPEVLEGISRLESSSLEKAESLEQLRWLENGYSIRIRTVEHDPVGIDTPGDLERAREFIRLHHS